MSGVGEGLRTWFVLRTSGPQTLGAPTGQDASMTPTDLEIPDDPVMVGRRRHEAEALNDYRTALRLLYGPNHHPSLDRSKKTPVTDSSTRNPLG